MSGSRSSMFHATVCLHWIFLLLLFLGQKTGSSRSVRHQRSMIAKTGESVVLNCESRDMAEVLQVTWQKIQHSLSENISTYSRRYGVKILPQFERRFSSNSSEVRSSCLTIHNVTLEDEACYRCIFNVFPAGHHMRETCLIVHTVSALSIELSSKISPDALLEVVCSMTGKPAPQISCYAQSVLLGPAKEHHILNPNGTELVTKQYTLSLEAIRSWKIFYLVCVADHPVRRAEEIVALPQELEPLDLHWRTLVFPIISATFVLIIVIGTLAYIFRRKNKKRAPISRVLCTPVGKTTPTEHLQSTPKTPRNQNISFCNEKQNPGSTVRKRPMENSRLIPDAGNSSARREIIPVEEDHAADGCLNHSFVTS
ncbi:OX-2 membrane glycoprotein-like [Tachyglossus aculeatus]|uniref:OX-2 membrane glycoprotein-like n=1 Tax=Tachyglossus aculeatus TaxID=9261 RepID=UPI0018F27994|nr:OX-2 membrane glycoprotein-like [Tachyglossus aculeatus]XP_038622230.1 OX-2 membrane glycoprotein-like [Tachyglossus aculeatus]